MAADAVTHTHPLNLSVQLLDLCVQLIDYTGYLRAAVLQLLYALLTLFQLRRGR